MEPSTPTWHPHPMVLRVAAYAVCVIVIGYASGMVLELLSQLSIVLVPVLVAIYLTRILAVPGNWLTAHGWRPAPATATAPHPSPRRSGARRRPRAGCCRSPSPA